MNRIAPDPDERVRLYAQVTAELADSLRRLTRAYEMDDDLRRDLYQDMQVEIWNSLAIFQANCSLRTWVFRVAHNVGARHVLRQMRRRASRHVALDEAENLADFRDASSYAEDASALDAILRLVHTLKLIDRQVILLYLEDLDTQSIADVVGLSPGNVSIKIHRIKQLLSKSIDGSES
jgi:RNA polymerase sigma-70 factor (ECF subfamily)